MNCSQQIFQPRPQRRSAYVWYRSGAFQKSASLTLLRAIGTRSSVLVRSLLVQVLIVMGGGILIGVAHLRKFGLAEECVVVDDHLAVERDHFLFLGDDQRIDLGKGSVRVLVNLPQAHRDPGEILPVIAGQVDGNRHIARLKQFLEKGEEALVSAR